MGKKNGVPRQAENTWRLVIDFTDEQAVEFNQLMEDTNKSAAYMLDLMRIGKAHLDGYVYIGQPEGDWKSISYSRDGKTATFYAATKDVDLLKAR